MKIIVEDGKLMIAGEGIDYVEIEGVLYSYELFRTLAFPRTDRLYSFFRAGHSIHVTDHGPATPPAKLDA